MKRAVQGRKAPLRFCSKAFTLVELLAVIAIIAILAALLFPMIGKSMERAKQTQCLSNMRQWGSGLTLYLGDHEGIFPAEGMESSGLNVEKPDAWFNVLAEYMGMPETLGQMCANMHPPRPGDKSVFVCPSLEYEDIRDESGAPATPGQREAVFSYAYNLWMDHGGRSGEHSGSTAFGTRLRMSQLKHPAKTVVFGEVAQIGFDNMSGQHLRFRHNGTNSVNLAFADGHAENFFWTNVFVNTSAHGNPKQANVGVIWDPEGDPPQTDPSW